MQDRPDEQLILDRLRALVEARMGSVAALEERLGLAPGELAGLRTGGTDPDAVSLRLLYRILETLDLDPKDFFSRIYDLPPLSPAATLAGEGAAADDEFPPFGRVVDTVRLLVRDGMEAGAPPDSGAEPKGSDPEDLEMEEAKG
jgi:transcriptional regulator with XRE-family HTH domain